ncbi:MAG: hypothetical protein LBB34_01500 [Holosporales bacterium]|jgi:orotate phosphoribosyltransferase-like protein|nr:hypothetical protein [Holosporales bacterium]
MIPFKNFARIVFVGWLFYSFLPTLVFVNGAAAKSSSDASGKRTIAAQAKSKVKEMYARLQKLASMSADVESMESFLNDHFDVQAIAKRFGVERNTEFEKSLAKFFSWRFKNEAMKAVASTVLGENFLVTEKKRSVVVKGSLGSGETAIEFIVIFVITEQKEALGKVKEIIVVGIPLIEGLTSITSKYCKENKINFKKLAPAERCNVIKNAIDNFLANN